MQHNRTSIAACAVLLLSCRLVGQESDGKVVALIDEATRLMQSDRQRAGAMLRSACRMIEDQESSMSNPVELWLRVVKLARDSSQFDSEAVAWRSLSRLRASDTGSSRTYRINHALAMADHAVQSGKSDQARPHLAQAAKLLDPGKPLPSDYQQWQRLGPTARSAADFGPEAAAWQSLGKIYESDPVWSRTYRIKHLLARADHAIQSGERDDARAQVAEALRLLDPQKPSVDAFEDWKRLGLASFAAQASTSEVAAWQAITGMYGEVDAKRDPTKFEGLQYYRTLLANALGRGGELKSAQREFEAIIGAYEGDARYSEALQRVRADYSVALNQFGYQRRAAAVQREILEYFEKRDKNVDASPDVQQARRALANTLHDMNQADEEPLELRSLAVTAYEQHILPSVSKEQRADFDREYFMARTELATSWFGRREHLEAEYRKCHELLRIMEKDKKWPEHDPAVMFVRVTLGDMARMIGDLKMSQALLEKDIAIRSKGPPNDYQLRVSLNGLGMTSFFQGDYARSKELAQRAVELLEQNGNELDPLLQDARGNLACTLIALHENEAAIDLLEKTLDVYSEIQHPYRRMALADLGVALRITGRLPEAVKRFEEAFGGNDALKMDGLDRVWFSYINVSGFRKNYLLALAALGASHEAVLTEQMNKAVAKADSALQTIVTFASREIASNARSIGESLDVVWSLAPRAGVAMKSRLYRDMFELRETMRSLTVFSQARIHRARSAMREWDERRRDVNRRLGELSKPARSAANRQEDIVDAVRERAELEKQLRENSRLFGPQDPVSIERIQTRLERNAAAVVFRRVGLWAFPDRAKPHAASCADMLVAEIVPSRGALETVVLAPIGDVRKAVARWRSEVASGNEEAVRTAGREIFDLVLRKVFAKTSERVLHVCVEDVLHLVPLSVLPEGGSGFVGDSREIRCHISLDHLRRPDIGRKPIKRKSFVVVGGVAYGRKPEDPDSRFWRAVDGSGEEAGVVLDLLKEKFRSDEPHHLEGSKVSKEALCALLSGARFIHLATHCFLDEGRLDMARSTSDSLAMNIMSRRTYDFAPLTLAGVVLSGANEDRTAGILTAHELVEENLTDCSLAVLSRCAVSADTPNMGERVESLCRGLHAAGVESLLLSLWIARSEHSKVLVKKFYERFLAGDPAHRALWRARRALIDRDLPARAWAGWMLTGQ